MSQFMILIYGDEKRWRGMSQEEREDLHASHGEFWKKAGEAIIASGELQGSGTAVTVRRGTDGEPVPVDGPFTEAKEVVGGFYVVDVPDKATAVSLASELAEARHDHSGVQVQPLVDHSAG